MADSTCIYLLNTADSWYIYLSKMADSTCIYLLNTADSRWQTQPVSICLARQTQGISILSKMADSTYIYLLNTADSRWQTQPVSICLTRHTQGISILSKMTDSTCIYLLNTADSGYIYLVKDGRLNLYLSAKNQKSSRDLNLRFDKSHLGTYTLDSTPTKVVSGFDTLDSTPTKVVLNNYNDRVAESTPKPPMTRGSVKPKLFGAKGTSARTGNSGVRRGTSGSMSTARGRGRGRGRQTLGVNPPQCELDVGLKIIENDRDLDVLYEYAHDQGIIQVYITHGPQDLSSYYVENMCLYGSEDDVNSLEEKSCSKDAGNMRRTMSS
ncbi:hypothetical protein Tco_1023859 [Tanacetum coccineum]